MICPLCRQPLIRTSEGYLTCMTFGHIGLLLVAAHEQRASKVREEERALQKKIREAFKENRP
jgi:uncharacterized Zn finger protein (UPF0148 family)